MKALILVASTKAPARDPDALLPPHIIECTPAKLYRSLDMVRPLVWAFVDHPDTPEAVRYACVVDACKQRPGSPGARPASNGQRPVPDGGARDGGNRVLPALGRDARHLQRGAAFHGLHDGGV